VQSGSGEFTLTARFQGCADQGLCYPPEQRNAPLVLGAAANELAPPATGSASAAGSSTPAHPGRFETALQAPSLVKVLPIFFALGLLLSFTPCVLPMLPILSSIIVGQSGRRSGGEDRDLSKSRAFVLALAYSLGMATVYTAFGIAAGLAGEGLGG